MTEHTDAGRVSIRRAEPPDAAALLEFRLGMMGDVFGEKAWLGVDRETLRAANEKWIGEHFGRDFIAWIADLDGRPVASVGLMWFPHPPGPLSPGGREAYILNVYTRPEARRLGLARMLMERAVEEARAAGVRRVWLRASDDGRPLYESMGFGPRNYLELTPD
jgi:GNAT superfamily N-acetyltransferase